MKTDWKFGDVLRRRTLHDERKVMVVCALTEGEYRVIGLGPRNAAPPGAVFYTYGGKVIEVIVNKYWLLDD